MLSSRFFFSNSSSAHFNLLSLRYISTRMLLPWSINDSICLLSISGHSEYRVLLVESDLLLVNGEYVMNLLFISSNWMFFFSTSILNSISSLSSSMMRLLPFTNFSFWRAMMLSRSLNWTLWECTNRSNSYISFKALSLFWIISRLKLNSCFNSSNFSQRISNRSITER